MGEVGTIQVTPQSPCVQGLVIVLQTAQMTSACRSIRSESGVDLVAWRNCADHGGERVLIHETISIPFSGNDASRSVSHLLTTEPRRACDPTRATGQPLLG